MLHKLEVSIDTTERKTEVRLNGEVVEDFSSLTLTDKDSPFGFSFDMVSVEIEDMKRTTILSASQIRTIKELDKQGCSHKKISGRFNCSSRYISYLVRNERRVSKEDKLLKGIFDYVQKHPDNKNKIDISKAKEAGIEITHGNLLEGVIANLKKQSLKKKGR